VRDFLGKKAFFGSTIEHAITHLSLLVHSHHVFATHRSLYSHRKKTAIQRDIAAWIVLMSTVNLTASKNNEWFKCYVNLSRLNTLAGFNSLSRASNFLSFYKKTDLVRVKYKKSLCNNERKYCEIYISRKAFELTGVASDALDIEIVRKQKNDLKRIEKKGTMEYETAQAQLRTIYHRYCLKKKALAVQKKQKRAIEKKIAHEKEQSLEKRRITMLDDAQRIINLQKKHPTLSYQAKKKKMKNTFFS
jgi:hypothetical protein